MRHSGRHLQHKIQTSQLTKRKWSVKNFIWRTRNSSKPLLTWNPELKVWHRISTESKQSQTMWSWKMTVLQPNCKRRIAKSMTYQSSCKWVRMRILRHYWMLIISFVINEKSGKLSSNSWMSNFWEKKKLMKRLSKLLSIQIKPSWRRFAKTSNSSF